MPAGAPALQAGVGALIASRETAARAAQSGMHQARCTDWSSAIGFAGGRALTTRALLIIVILKTLAGDKLPPEWPEGAQHGVWKGENLNHAGGER